MATIKPINGGSVIKINPVSKYNQVKVNKVDHVIIEDVPMYSGAYEVTPKSNTAIVLETKNKKMIDDVTVKKIPYYKTKNTYGNTIYIASEV